MKAKTRNQKYNAIVSATEKNLNACVVELAESYLEDFPDSQGGWDMYSLALYRIDRLQDAKKAVLKAIKLLDDSDKRKRSSWLLHRLGHIYESSGNVRKAIEYYEKAHNSNRSEATFLIYKGIMLLRTEKFDEAADVLHKATECDEGCIDEAFYNLGVARLIQKSYKESQICFEKALKIDPKYKEAMQQLKDVKKVMEILEQK
jgi:tetratricopeptide (TPR) repeat protein